MSATAVTTPRDRRLTVVRRESAGHDFATDVRRGLTSTPKSLPPRWFYDDLGSALFDAICFLPEYYVMRAEAEVLTANAKEIAAALGPIARMVELGSGAARKTRILLRELTAGGRELEYVPVDIDASMLERSAHDLLREFAPLRITAIAADFTTPSLPLASLAPIDGHTAVLFLGSTIGNFDPADAAAMLHDLRAALRAGDVLLLGADLRKSKSVLEPAYDDALGVTAAFNLNLLQRINRELGGTFDLDSFGHQAFYDEELGRIEMHLVSRLAQRVRIAALDLDVLFDAGESIHTENSYKHDLSSISALAAASGFEVTAHWVDREQRFIDVLLTAR